jgi:hypothetical protein
MEATKLTEEQIKNWRKMLCGILGPYALIMPVEDIEKMRYKIQEQVDKLPTKELSNG